MPGYFNGWYLKCQSATQTLAVIPAIHRERKNACTCSIQVITEENAWVVPFPSKEFHKTKHFFSIGENHFGRKGLKLAICTPELHIKGTLRFGPLFPLKYDIMGPFAFIPFMECRHSVWSMQHSVCGTVQINGQTYSFHNACGYWEGDQGRSFPKEYAWTQCCFQGGSLMLSVADIPFMGFHFTGAIGVVLWQGREYRLATYLGARVVQLQDGRIRICQGNMVLDARLLKKHEHPLNAPVMGNMIRTIHESATCLAYYRFQKERQTLFAFKTNKASFEYEYPYKIDQEGENT